MDHPFAARAVTGRRAANAKRSKDCAPEEPVEGLLWVICLKMYNVTWSEISLLLSGFLEAPLILQHLFLLLVLHARLSLSSASLQPRAEQQASILSRQDQGLLL